MTCHDQSGAVWVLGATGRSGRGVTAQLVARGVDPVLVGRDAPRLAAVRDATGALRTVVAASVTEMAAAVVRDRPAVVVNTVGPFTDSAPVVADACLRVGADHVDLANDLATTGAMLDRHGRAVTAGCRLVTGAGFGVTATESVVVRLCGDRGGARPAPARVRVDMVPSVASEGGRVGRALAATVLGGLPGVEGGGRFTGRRIEGGRLVRAGIGGAARQLRLPDGEQVTTAAIPTGELLAAHRASGAPEVVSASSAAPHGRLVRAVLPLVGALLGLGPVRRAAIAALAGLPTRATPAPRAHSWGHATVEQHDGTVVEGWLRVGDAQEFTSAVCAEVATRLLAGEGRPGASTPAALFGPGLVEACGGEHVTPAVTGPGG